MHTCTNVSSETLNPFPPLSLSLSYALDLALAERDLFTVDSGRVNLRGCGCPIPLMKSSNVASTSCSHRKLY